MTPDEWLKVRGILERALELAPADRAAYLEQACAGDPGLRTEVESLIRSNEQASTDFLERSVFEMPDPFAVTGSGSMTGKRIGPYQIVEEIGHGGMGSVFRAVRADDQYRKEVAIKLVRAGLGDPFRMHRFKAERQILADLDHPNIARLLDGGELEDGQPYVVMEYIEGEPIDDYCRGRKLSVTDRLRLFRTVCEAVAYAHQRLVIHRDIKPANILVTEAGAPKLLDFGIAKIVDAGDERESANATVTVLRQMTPEYASPEQVRGEPITTASDVYSLGVVLYGLLTGHRPYPDESRLPHEIAQAVCDVQAEKPSTVVLRRPTSGDSGPPSGMEGTPEKLRRRLAGDLDNIVLKALRKEPERRYGSVEQFSEDIRRHLEGQPVLARSDAFWYRAGKFVIRHKAGVAAAVLMAVTLIAGLVITARETYIARAERARAEKRFNDVRELANSLVFEVHDAIQNLPGATAARKLIVDRALRYLDTLASEASDNHDLQRELAAAYQKVGDVQGGFRQANLGDSAGALVSYRKSASILESVASDEPDNPAVQRELVTAHGKLSDLLLMTGDRAGALDQLRQLLVIAEKLAAANPGNLADRRNLALAYLDYGWKRVGRNDWRSALDDVQKSVSLLESVVAADGADRRSRRVLALAYSRSGELLSSYSHDHKASLAMHQKAIGVLQGLLSKDPQNTDLQHLEAWEILSCGDETVELGDPSGALDLYRTALGKMREFAEADTHNMQIRVQIAIARGRIGAALIQHHDPARAFAELEASLAEAGRLSDSNASNADLSWTMAFDQFQIGRAHAAQAEDPKRSAAAHRQSWQQALLAFQRALPALEASKGGSYNDQAEDTLAQAQADIARCQRALDTLSASLR